MPPGRKQEAPAHVFFSGSMLTIIPKTGRGHLPPESLQQYLAQDVVSLRPCSGPKPPCHEALGPSFQAPLWRQGGLSRGRLQNCFFVTCPLSREGHPRPVANPTTLGGSLN